MPRKDWLSRWPTARRLKTQESAEHLAPTDGASKRVIVVGLGSTLGPMAVLAHAFEEISSEIRDKALDDGEAENGSHP